MKTIITDLGAIQQKLHRLLKKSHKNGARADVIKEIGQAKWNIYQAILNIKEVERKL